MITLQFRDYIIITLLGIILIMRACGPGKCPAIQPAKVVSTDTTFIRLHDTFSVVKLVPVTKIIEHRPVPITVSDTIFLTEGIPVDTLKILADYFATRNYSDTNRIAYGDFIIQDAISQNKIKNRQIIYNLNIPEVKQIAIIPQRNKVYIGLDLGASNFLSFGPEMVLKTKTDKLYWAGVSFTSQNQFYYHLGTAWLIHF